MKRNTPDDHWRINLGLAAAIMATVMIALVMMQLDALQAQRPLVDRLHIANIQATAVSNGAIINLPFNIVAEAPPQAVPGGPVVPDSNPRTTGAVSAIPADFPVCGEVPAGWLLYTAVSGDTVALLAAATQSDPNVILAANCLAADALTEGMQILLPSQPAPPEACGPPQTWVRYQVRAGDTMAQLAISRNTTVADVLRANCRDSEALSAGQMIFLPPGGPAFPPVVTPPPLPPFAPTATPAIGATVAPPPPNPTSGPPGVPTNPPLPTSVVPTIPGVPTETRPTVTPTIRPTATVPGFPTSPATATSPAPTATRPVATATRPAPTATRPAPTATAPRPTNTPVPPPTNTPPPPPTNTPPPPPTDTPVPPPTDTPIPPPTDTPVPPPTDTPIPPPTDTPEPPPTDTPEPPPPDTPVPQPPARPQPRPQSIWNWLSVWRQYWR